MGERCAELRRMGMRLVVFAADDQFVVRNPEPDGDATAAVGVQLDELGESEARRSHGCELGVREERRPSGMPPVEVRRTTTALPRRCWTT